MAAQIKGAMTMTVYVLAYRTQDGGLVTKYFPTEIEALREKRAFEKKGYKVILTKQAMA